MSGSCTKNMFFTCVGSQLFQELHAPFQEKKYRGLPLVVTASYMAVKPK